jgi:type II secretory ATPase GspE/PulE/Tfp pilus assembly ATPase PilB-like protein
MGGATTTFKSLEELGMREKMIEQYKDLMLHDNGVLILSSMPGGGLSSTLNVSLRSTDRLLRDFVSLESVKDRLEEVENVDPTTYDIAAGEIPAKMLPTLLRKQPDVLIVPDLPDAETVSILCAAAIEDNLIFTTIRAKEAVEALMRILLLKVPAKEFAPVAIGVLNQRLVRKLCEDCKEPYTPSPALLKKLGIPPGRVDEFFRHPEEPEEVCQECHGIGYVGRTAIFELLTVNDAMRAALINQPKLEVLRNVARQAGHRTLQEEGIATVVRGITSLPELMRVLKQ